MEEVFTAAAYAVKTLGPVTLTLHVCSLLLLMVYREICRIHEAMVRFRQEEQDPGRQGGPETGVDGRKGAPSPASTSTSRSPHDAHPLLAAHSVEWSPLSPEEMELAKSVRDGVGAAAFDRVEADLLACFLRGFVRHGDERASLTTQRLSAALAFRDGLGADGLLRTPPPKRRLWESMYQVRGRRCGGHACVWKGEAREGRDGVCGWEVALRRRRGRAGAEHGCAGTAG